MRGVKPRARCGAESQLPTAVPAAKEAGTHIARCTLLHVPGTQNLVPCPAFLQAFRLYTEASFQQLPPSTLPEIQRTNLASVVLQVGLVNWQCGSRLPGRRSLSCQSGPCAYATV